MSDLEKTIADGMKSVSDEIAAVKADLDAKISEHTAQVVENGKTSTRLTDQINELTEKHQNLLDEVTQLSQKAHPVSAEPAAKSAGEAFVASDAFKELASANRRDASVRVEIPAKSMKNTTINSNLSAVFGDSTSERCASAFRL